MRSAAGNGVHPGGELEATPLLKLSPLVPRSQAIDLASAPSTPPQKLTPTVGYNVSQADRDSASAYAVTALADATDAGVSEGSSGAGGQQLLPSAAGRSGSIAEPVDWQRVARQADSLPAAAAAQPAGSVARLRAIFEQQTRYTPIHANMQGQHGTWSSVWRQDVCRFFATMMLGA